MTSTSSSTQLPLGKLHNMIAYLVKPTDQQDFHQIIDFLHRSHIYYSLTVSPRVSRGHINDFWVNASIEEVQGSRQIVSTVENARVVVTEATIRSVLHFDDEGSITFLTDQVLFDNLRLMGYEGDYSKFTFQKTLFSPQWKFLIHTLLHCLSSKRSAFEQFGSSIAYAVVCLATAQRFVQLILNEQISNLSAQDTVIIVPQHKPKVFSNMQTQALHFSGRTTTLFSTMLYVPSTKDSVNPTETEPVTERVDPSTTSQPIVAGDTKRKQGTSKAKPSKAKKARNRMSEAHAALSSQSLDSGPEQHVVQNS